MHTDGEIGVEGHVFVGYHVVCTIDLLGQSEKLSKWSRPPKSGKLDSEFIAALKETAGTVEVISNAFGSCFHQMELVHDQKRLDLLPPIGREYFARAKECKLGMQQFADTFVMYAPIQDSTGGITNEPIFRMLVATASVMMMSLGGRVPMRGGIAVEMGMERRRSNFYGPALATAHHIENKIAQYPRVVLDREAVKFLGGRSGFNQHPYLEQICRERASWCDGLVCVDADGESILDWLGPTIRGFNSNPPPENVAAAISKAEQFAREESDRFSAAGNARLADRYRQLEEYIRLRLPAWR